MKTAILVAPLFDEATRYSFSWSREVKELLESSGFNVIDLSGGDITRADVENAISSNPGSIYIHYDHGNESSHLCNPTSACIDLTNVKLLSGREVYTMNCLSARKLGVEAWKQGCKAYWGYIEEFAFTTDALDEFKEFANSGIKYWILGYSWSDTIKIVKEEANELLDKLTGSGRIIAAVSLSRDVDALKCWNAEAPSSDISSCPFRRLAIKLFGRRVGWKLQRRFAVSSLLFGLGLGIMLHDFAHECWLYGGYKEILSLQGFYVGSAISIIAFLMACHQIITQLRS